MLMLSSIGIYKIPTWTSPLLACVFASILLSNISFLGHLCAVLVGYLREYSILYCSNLILTCVSRSWLPQDLRPSRKGPPMDRGQAEPPRATATLRVRGSEDIWSLWRASFYKHRGGSTGTLDLLGIYAASGDFQLMRRGRFLTLHVVCILSIVCMFLICILVRNLNDYEYCQGRSGIAIVQVAQVVTMGGRIFDARASSGRGPPAT